MPSLPLAHSVLGDGPPVLVLHGLLGQSRNWQGIARSLAERYRVFMVDLRNHGASPHDDEMTYPAMAGDVARLIEEAGLDRPAVIGHSMGGKVAMTTALLDLVPLDRIAVIDISPVPYPNSVFVHYLEAMMALDLSARQRRSQVEIALTSAIADKAVRAFLAGNIVQRGESLAWAANLPVLRRALPSIAGFPEELLERRSDLPALFLRGGKSAYVQESHKALIGRLFPAAEIRSLEEAGHWVQSDAPEATLRNLLAFLAGG